MLMRMAFRAISHHKMRSLLTLLGIVIGIAGIIAIVSLGKGAQKRARDQHLAYGSKSIDLDQGNRFTSTKKPPKPLTLDDIDVIKAQCPSIQYISPCSYCGSVAVEYEGNTSSANVEGVNENSIHIAEQKMQSGSNFSQQDVERKENVVVLSPEMAEFFFKLQDPCGKIIRIDKKPFTVIGVLAPPKIKGKWEGVGLPKIFIPFPTYQKYFGRFMGWISMSTYTNEQVPEAVRQLEKIFRAAHHLEDGEPNDFMIWDRQTFAAAAEEAAKSVGLFAIIAALIALLVGGIGVMNIMLVAVQERTKEIGIKAALGATMNMIRMQFLLEAVVICMIGGLIGVTFGVSASIILDRIFKIPAIVELAPVLAAFFFTALIGLVFGFYPAERAARLRPVEALTEQ
jgi:putative ABC transport system permease protein